MNWYASSLYRLSSASKSRIACNGDFISNSSFQFDGVFDMIDDRLINR